MKKDIRKDFVEEIRKSLPDNTNAAIYLADRLGLGKETVYRRLRGKIPFSLDEAAKVAADLGISLNRLAGIDKSSGMASDLHMDYFSDFNENFNEMISASLDALTKVARDPSGIYIMAANFLPYRFYCDYKAISEFRFRRWLYERGQVSSFRTGDLNEIQQGYREVTEKLQEVIHKIGGTYMIWDPNVFLSLVREIKYFRMLSMIPDDDVRRIREELLDIIDKLEDEMIKGRTSQGTRSYFYLSNVVFDTSYSYLESKDLQISYFHVYVMHTIRSESPEVCAIQKAWLQTILQHSTLITQSGEIERAAYLKEQRALVAGM